MSDFHTMVKRSERTKVSAVPATPPRRPASMRARTSIHRTPAFSGLATPPPSVHKHGRTSRSGTSSPASSFETEVDDIDCVAPAQPSLSTSVAPVTSYSHIDAAPPVALDNSSLRNPLFLLATELIHMVASNIDSDQDLVHFSQSCKHIHSNINDDNNTFWRGRFLSKYEKPRSVEAKKWKNNNSQYKKEYQLRRSSLRKGALFKLGKTGPEKMCLQVLRELINDCFSGRKDHEEKYPDMIYEGHNLATLVRFCQNEDILRSLLNPRNVHRRAIGGQTVPDPLLQAIQTILCPLILSDVGGQVHDFPSSQIAAYSPATTSPIFKGSYGGSVNMDWVLHQANFWRYHFTREAETSLYTEIDAVDPADRPQLWGTQLSQDRMPPLGKNWKGISAFLPPAEMNEMREDEPRDDIMDEFSGSESGGAIQDLALHFAPHSATSEAASRIFNNALNAHSPRKHTKTRSDPQDDAKSSGPRPFILENTEGGNKDGEWIGDGYLSPLPSQSGISGWQRMSMMKYWRDSNGSINDLSLWAYEGVMLPGGRTVIGRWWSPDENANTHQQYSGPFILWNTEE